MVNHDHFLSLRLDVDIDGPANTLGAAKVVRQRVSNSNGRRSSWCIDEENRD